MKTSSNPFSGWARMRAHWIALAGATVGALGLAMPAMASLQAPLTVGPQAGTLTAPTPGSVTFTVTVRRSNGGPANPTMSVTGLPAGATGVFGTPSAWSPATGTGTRTYPLTVTTTALAVAGATNFSVSAAFTGSTTRTGTGTLAINPNVITFAALTTRTYLDPPFNVSATSNSGLPVSFAASGNCTVAGTLVTITGAGSCTITASQAGNALWNPATSVPRTFTINKASQTISWNALPTRYLGDSDFTLTPVASSGLAVTLASTTPTICTVAGNLVHLEGVTGTCSIAASQAGDANYLAATDTPGTFAVEVFTGTELHAVAGSTTLPDGANVAVWGYNGTAVAVTQPGGPVLTYAEGATVAIRLHNDLATETTALLIEGVDMIPDTTGVAPGGTRVYTFTATRPGTYLYEAGLLPNAQHQVAMGLYGALVVQSATAGQAYDDAATAFTVEKALVLSEIDPALNAAPATFDMRNFAPKYFLINGKAYPATDAIASAAGDKVLLRYVNAGVKHHSMAVLGLRQNVVAKDASVLPTKNVSLTAETIAPGQTADAIATVPATATDGSRFAVYDASLMLHNGAAPGMGGMLTFVSSTGGAGTGAGPLVSALTVTPALTVPPVQTTFDATITSATGTVDAAEFWVDSGAHAPITVTAGASVIVTAQAIPPQTTGSHVLHVRGSNDGGTTWGTIRSAAFAVDADGPVTSGQTLSPNPSNGNVSVTLHATGNDTTTGGSNVDAAEYFIGAAGANGTGSPMAVNKAAPVASLSATIPAQAASTTVYVHSRDVWGHWGAFATINLNVVGSGGAPTTGSVTASRNPNNGALPLTSSQPVVRVSTTVSTTLPSTVVAAEGFFCVPVDPCTAGANGTGFPLIAADGAWGGASEAVYADIPLATINGLAPGNHTIRVHGKDAAGNWGAMGSTVLLIDKTPPTVSSISRAAADSTMAATLPYTVTFSEPVTGLTAANFALTYGGGMSGATITSVTGSNAVWTVTVTRGTNGSGGTLRLDLTNSTGLSDIAGNAIAAGLPFAGQPYTVRTPRLSFSTFGNSNPPGVGGTSDDADIYFWSDTTSTFSRVIDATAAPYSVPAGANVDGFDRIDATHFYMSFNGTVVLPGLGTVEDEDVVYWNNGVWQMYFDGSANGLVSANFDLDAISIVGGALYFSTDNGNTPPGAGGTGDDADIYRWNGGSSYTRVVNASGNNSLGLPAAANVDGLVYVDSTHFYLSFAADTTVPVPGPDLAVQDEDVVYYNGSLSNTTGPGRWSIYFDGTGKGLTSGNLDVDAFDINP